MTESKPPCQWPASRTWKTTSSMAASKAIATACTIVNTYRWDYPQLAAMLAPRPLLVANTDRDTIFPLEGVLDVHRKTRRLYAFNDKLAELGLQIAAGGHNDLQVLQLHALQWFNAHFRDDNSTVESVAKKHFEPEQLKVFDSLPTDAINARIHETFVPLAETPPVPETQAQWQSQRDAWLAALRQKCFAGWPAEDDAIPLNVRPVMDQRIGELRYFAFDFDSQHDVTLRLYLVLSADDSLSELQLVELQPLDSAGWADFIAELPDALPDKMASNAAPLGKSDDKIPFDESVLMFDNCGLAFVAPRGIGPTAWNADPAKQTHIRRRFMLLGQTLDGMRVWDVRRALQALRSINGLPEVQLRFRGERKMAGIALYAVLFEPEVDDLDLSDLSMSHRNGPDFLNVLRILDIPQTVAMVAENSDVRIHQDADGGWEYPRAVAKMLGLEEQLEVKDMTESEEDSQLPANSAPDR